jgi:hypothetical protein
VGVLNLEPKTKTFEAMLGVCMPVPGDAAYNKRTQAEGRVVDVTERGHGEIVIVIAWEGGSIIAYSSWWGLVFTQSLSRTAAGTKEGQ